MVTFCWTVTLYWMVTMVTWRSMVTMVTWRWMVTWSVNGYLAVNGYFVLVVTWCWMVAPSAPRAAITADAVVPEPKAEG
jgi:hypothetical protein